MMDNFLSFQRASQMPFHHYTVFEPSNAIPTDDAVAVDADVPALVARVVYPAVVETSPLTMTATITKPMSQR